MAGVGCLEVFADLPGGFRARRYGPTDRAEVAVLVVGGEGKEPGAGEGARDDDRLIGLIAKPSAPPKWILARSVVIETRGHGAVLAWPVNRFSRRARLSSYGRAESSCPSLCNPSTATK
ncbi:hypothetical protein [Streptomyces sp. NPDC091268]|uniref:hypothetical protein n=1 Tax=Streptomyces sp. NPDC091268 TaxID=3365979 RepID=UPI003826D8D3